MSFASDTNYSLLNSASTTTPSVCTSPVKSSPLPLGKRKITVILKDTNFSPPRQSASPLSDSRANPPTPDSPPISPVKKMIKVFDNEKASTLSPQSALPISPTKIQSPAPIIKWRVRKVVRGNTEIIDPTPPPRVKKMIENGEIESAIYRFKDSVSGRRYGGSVFATDKNTLIERMNGYKKEFNSESKKKRHIANALRKNPEDFEVGVVHTYPANISETDLHIEEEKYIVEHRTLNPKYGFNKSLPTDEPLRAAKSRRNASSEVLAAQKAYRKPSLALLPPPRQNQPRASAEQAKLSIHAQLSNEDLEQI